MNGKLARLAQQEADGLSAQKSDASDSVTGGTPEEGCRRTGTQSKKKKKKLKRTRTEES